MTSWFSALFDRLLSHSEIHFQHNLAIAAAESKAEHVAHELHDLRVEHAKQLADLRAAVAAIEISPKPKQLHARTFREVQSFVAGDE